MKKALSLILALVLCLSLCACGTAGSEFNNQTETTTVAPQTVVLTTDNFYQYFDVEYSIDVTESDDVWRNGSLQGFIATATATVKIIPKFSGTWSDFKAEISWHVSDYVWGFWAGVSPYNSQCTIEQPDEEDGERVETIVCSENYKSGEVPATMDTARMLYDSPPLMTTPTVENVSGVIVIEGIVN